MCVTHAKQPRRDVCKCSESAVRVDFEAKADALTQLAEQIVHYSTHQKTIDVLYSNIVRMSTVVLPSTCRAQRLSYFLIAKTKLQSIAPTWLECMEYILNILAMISSQPISIELFSTPKNKILRTSIDVLFTIICHLAATPWHRKVLCITYFDVIFIVTPEKTGLVYWNFKRSV